MKRKKRLALFLLLGACIAGAGVSGWGILRESRPGIETEHLYSIVRDLVFAEKGGADQEDALEKGAGSDQPGLLGEMRGAPDWEILKAWNQDIVGWIYSPGTAIDYPVLQGEDNTYYLNHTPDRKKSIIGSVFLESRNRADFGDDVSVLYGHQIRSGRMFSSLSGYKRQSYYEEHPYIYLYTPDASYRVWLFAGAVINGAEGSFPLQFAEGRARSEWLDSIMGASTFRTKALPEEGQRILALCTCSYEYDDARYVVYGAMEIIEGK